MTTIRALRCAMRSSVVVEANRLVRSLLRVPREQTRRAAAAARSGAAIFAALELPEVGDQQVLAAVPDWRVQHKLNGEVMLPMSVEFTDGAQSLLAHPAMTPERDQALAGRWRAFRRQLRVDPDLERPELPEF
jgi:hypothetical protein